MPSGGPCTIRDVHVVRVIAVLEPSGVVLSALRLSRALRAHGIESRIVAGDATPGGLQMARAHGFEVEHFSEVGDLQWRPCPQFAAWLAQRMADAELVHGHMFGAWWAAAAAAPPHVPVVASEHNALAWPRTGHDAAAAAAASRLACFFAHGPATAAWARRIGVPDTHIVAGESAIEGLDARPQADLPDRRITFAGRFHPEKGADVLLDALELVADPPPTFLLGDGEQRAELEHRVATLGLQDVVRFSGWQPKPERFIAGATVHVVPSRRDAWSQSAVLAMGLGVPVVGTAVEGLPETLGGGRGALVAPEDPRALAAAIGDVLAGRCPADLGAARAYARGFAPERIAGRYAAVYRTLAGRDDVAARPAA
jgi:glycosyltransferase involved in cell wall biosynthesis